MGKEQGRDTPQPLLCAWCGAKPASSLEVHQELSDRPGGSGSSGELSPEHLHSNYHSVRCEPFLRWEFTEALHFLRSLGENFKGDIYFKTY